MARLKAMPEQEKQWFISLTTDLVTSLVNEPY